MKKSFLYLAILAIFLAGFWGCNRAASPVTGESAGSAASGKIDPTIPPDFSLKNIMTGQTVKLSDYKGKLLIVDFWATWCPPCREEIPHFVQLYDKYKGKNFAILGVSLDDTPLPVKPFMKEYHMDYPVLMGNNQVQQAYDIEGIPTSVLIGQDGKIIQKYVGYRDEKVFEEQIQKRL